MHIAFFIARRYIRSCNRKTFIYKLSKLSCYSIALGSSILLLVRFTLNGIENLLPSLFFSYTPLLKIEPHLGKAFVNIPSLKENIIQIPGVVNVIELLEEMALIRFNGRQAMVTLKGVSNNFKESDFYKQCKQIDMDSFNEAHNAFSYTLIGKSLRRWLHSKDSPFTIEVFYPRQHKINHSLTISCKHTKLLINGGFSIDRTIDSKYIITPIDFVEKLINGAGKRTHWEIVTDSNANSKEIETNIKKILPKELKLYNQFEQNEAKYRAIYIERLIVYIIFTLVLLIASLHIFFMLCMSISDKKKDIALLASLGASPGQVGLVFFYGGILISLKGTLYGLIMAWIMGWLQQKFGFITLPMLKGIKSFPYPIQMKGVDFLFTSLLTILFGSLASLWPSQQAARLAKKGFYLHPMHI